jgi:hypothetical protein
LSADELRHLGQVMREAASGEGTLRANEAETPTPREFRLAGAEG